MRFLLIFAFIVLAQNNNGTESCNVVKEELQHYPEGTYRKVASTNAIPRFDRSYFPAICYLFFLLLNDKFLDCDYFVCVMLGENYFSFSFFAGQVESKKL